MKPNAILAIAMFAAAPPALAEPGAVARLDINSATVEQLAAAEGLDRILAEAIVKGRPYRTTDELVTHAILSAAQFARLEHALSVERN